MKSQQKKMTPKTAEFGKNTLRRRGATGDLWHPWPIAHPPKTIKECVLQLNFGPHSSPGRAGVRKGCSLNIKQSPSLVDRPGTAATVRYGRQVIQVFHEKPWKGASRSFSEAPKPQPSGGELSKGGTLILRWDPDRFSVLRGGTWDGLWSGPLIGAAFAVAPRLQPTRYTFPTSMERDGARWGTGKPMANGGVILRITNNKG